MPGVAHLRAQVLEPVDLRAQRAALSIADWLEDTAQSTSFVHVWCEANPHDSEYLHAMCLIPRGMPALDWDNLTGAIPYYDVPTCAIWIDATGQAPARAQTDAVPEIMQGLLAPPKRRSALDGWTRNSRIYDNIHALAGAIRTHAHAGHIRRAMRGAPAQAVLIHKRDRTGCKTPRLVVVSDSFYAREVVSLHALDLRPRHAVRIDRLQTHPLDVRIATEQRVFPRSVLWANEDRKLDFSGWSMYI